MPQFFELAWLYLNPDFEATRGMLQQIINRSNGKPLESLDHKLDRLLSRRSGASLKQALLDSLSRDKEFQSPREDGRPERMPCVNSAVIMRVKELVYRNIRFELAKYPVGLPGESEVAKIAIRSILSDRRYEFGRYVELGGVSHVSNVTFDNPHSAQYHLSTIPNYAYDRPLNALLLESLSSR